MRSRYPAAAAAVWEPKRFQQWAPVRVLAVWPLPLEVGAQGPAQGALPVVVAQEAAPKGSVQGVEAGPMP